MSVRIGAVLERVSQLEVRAFDALDPHEKYALWCRTGARLPDEPSLSDRMLLALLAYDGVLYELGNRYHFYLGGDKSLAALLSLGESSNRSDKDDEFVTHVFRLTVCQMIYRFTCAKKFGVANPDVKQLRINSWGREFCGEVLLPRYESLYLSIRDAFAAYREQRSAQYDRLLELLADATPSPEACAEINALNSLLRIEVLA